MKKFNLFALAAAGMLFAACSSDSVVDAGKDNPTEGQGKKYIAVGINLPTVPSTRTTFNDQFADGKESEWTVNNTTLAIFGADGNFKEAYTLTATWGDDTDPQVTKTSQQFVKEVTGAVKAGDQMLVVLNHNGLIKEGENHGLLVKGAALSKGTYATDYEALCATLAETTDLQPKNMTEAGIFMTNAPLSDKQGGTVDCSEAKVRVLVPITAVYETEADAKAATPDHIYVERGVAKVTVAQAPTSTDVTGLTGYKFAISGWTIDNTNTKSYIIRSVEGNDDFRTLKSDKVASWRYASGTALLKVNDAYKYRTYFAKDPNFADAGTFVSLLAGGGSITYSEAFGDDNPMYCYENTFDVAHQNENQTTLVRLKVTVNKDGETAKDIYTINGVKSTVYEEAAVKTQIQNEAFKLATANPDSKPSTDIGVTLTRGTNGVVTFTITPATNMTLPTDVVDKVSAQLGQIVCYAGGVSYYTIRIKHFGDDLTPWNDGEDAANPADKKVGVGKVYPDHTNQANNYLGRYGVLRNNWYDLKVNSIKYLGDAEPLEPGTSTDDEIDAYITFQIHILNWAKRTQNWDL